MEIFKYLSFFLCIVFLSGCENDISAEQINLSEGPIIADHTVVELYDRIPQQWIDSVKTMWLSYAGESHSAAIRDGLRDLQSSNTSFPVHATESGVPESNTDSYLRVSRATWGDLNNENGWVYGYGEEDWFTTEQAVARTKAGIAYCNSNGLTISAFGFGWCWDPNINLASEFQDYIDATVEYINYCSANSIPTKVFFTTGTVDNDLYDYAEGEIGYQKYLGYEQIRNYVIDNNQILFDYADILCYDDGSSTANTTTWGGHTFPIISDNNGSPVQVGHISDAGALRLAKAMWWMLARIAGWDGSVATNREEVTVDAEPAVIRVNGDELIIEMKDHSSLPAQISLHNLQGSLVKQKSNPGNVCSFNTGGLPAGIYLVVISVNGLKRTQKIFIQ